ncbi:hypothetical protein [Haloarcula marismortui]|uniref:Uncharacterized protein n=1 Tax=Haloarcula marismortui ATCC 33800 TaxID=662476 RepID=M0K1C5_9EURY|nr:hypothetical protein [Haloarcula sinaiiensis]EMA14573.1 hypothetical protein C436_06744 [Haloarcula sinaiiensis ATCC 33800]QUJ71687.1 hypothetical protein KDQ40_13480 [Haloarcula sinaiiensis ATCC 33800]
MGLFDRIRRAVGGDDSSTDGDERTAKDNGPSDDGPDRLDTAALDPTTFREYAENVVDGADPLTFDPDALARLDTAIKESYGGETVGDAAGTTTYTENTVRFGSYLGELLVRAYDGEWVQSDGRWGVTVSGPDDEVTVAVFDVAARSFGDEPVFAAVVTRLESELALDSIQTPDGDGRADLEADETDADSVVSEPTRIVSRVGDAQADEREAPPEPTATDERGEAPAGDTTDSEPSQAVETEPTRIVKRVESESEADDRSDDTDPTPVASAVDDEPENEPPRGSDDPDSNESADSDTIDSVSDAAGSEPPATAATEEESIADPSDRPAADDTAPERSADDTALERSADDTATEWLADDTADEQPTVETLAEESAVDDSADEPAADTTDAVETTTDAAAADEPVAYIDEAESSFDSATADSSDETPAAETPSEDSAVDSRDEDGTDGTTPARAATDTADDEAATDTADDEAATDTAADEAATDTADDTSSDTSMDDEPTRDSSPDALSDAVPDAEAAAETTADESPADIADARVDDTPAAVSDSDTTELFDDSPNTSAPVADVKATDTSEHAASQDVTADETAATADTDESDLSAPSDSDSTASSMARSWESGTVRADYADTAVEFADFWGEHDLDFSPASLSRLDDLVDAEWDDERFAETTFGSDASFDDRAFTSVVRELGGYFGEVLVRNLDGDWTDETDHEAAVVVGGPAGQFAVPVFEVAITSLRKQAVFGRSYDALLDDLGREGPAR